MAKVKKQKRVKERKEYKMSETASAKCGKGLMNGCSCKQRWMTDCRSEIQLARAEKEPRCIPLFLPI